MARIRVFMAMVACWGLVGLPALCTGGIILHPCDCEHEEAGHEDDGCGHEAECESDPCNVAVVRSQETQEIVQWLQESPVADVPSALTTVDQSDALSLDWALALPPLSPSSSLSSYLWTTILLI